MYTDRINLDLQDCDVIIIPEQHLWDKPIASMPYMVSDNQETINEIYQLVSNCHNPVVILDGDVFHRGTPNTDNALILLDYLSTLSKLCNGRLYSVVGNHELSYRKGNVFWGVANISSKRIQDIVNTINIKTPLFTITDELKIGSELFCLGHYNIDFMGELDDEDIDNVTLITHSSFGNQELFDIMSKRDPSLNVAVLKVNNISRLGALPLTNKLKYVYVGHLHTCLGQFEITDTYNLYNYDFLLTYLGSLGRTSHNEYNIPTERKIPVHKIRQGRLSSVDYHLVKLKDRHDCIDEEKVALSREKYEEQKEIRELRSVKTQNINLISDIRSVFSDKMSLQMMFDSALIGVMPDDLKRLVTEEYVEV